MQGDILLFIQKSGQTQTQYYKLLSGKLELVNAGRRISRMNQTTQILEKACLWLTTLSVLAPLFGIALASIFLALALFAFVLLQFFNRQIRLKMPPILLPLLFFFVTTILSLAFSPEPSAGRAAINKFWLFLLIPLLASIFPREHLSKTMYGLWGAGTLAASFSIVQFFLVTHKPDGWRVTGFMGHWMTLSGELLLVGLACLAWILFVPIGKFLWWWLGLSLMAIAMLLTMTRSIWIAALFCMLLLIWMRFQHWKLLAGFITLLTLAGILMPGTVKNRIASIWNPDDPSNYARMAFWSAGIKMVQAHPWTGVGPQRISKVFYDYHPHPEDRRRSGFFPIHLHNNLLQFAAERGLPCALAWLWLICKWAYDHWRGFRRALPRSQEQGLHAIGLITVVALFLAGLFEFNFGDSEVLILTLLLTTIPYSFSQEKLAAL
jgi:putative inorganic carbon (HCO3(-)) transporter